MDEEHREHAQEEPEPERVEAAKRVERPDDAVLVRVEEIAVLLEDGLLCVVVGPVGRAVWGAQGRSPVGACGTWVYASCS